MLSPCVLWLWPCEYWRVSCLLCRYMCLSSRWQTTNLLCACLLPCVAGTRKSVSYLVSWCFGPSQPQRITTGLNTSFTLSPSHSFHKSFYHESWFFFLGFWWPIYIPRALNTGTCIQRSCFFYFILWAYTGTCVSHSLHRKKLGEVSKEEIPGSKRSMHGYMLTYSRL